jgi:predicted NUDIX family phosphoesterase
MKHPQHIVAFEKARFGLGELGPLVTMSPKTFFEAAYASLFIGRREELETDERFGQLLPYVALRRKAADGSVSLFLYQRTKQVGESRLGGKFSVGLGGHVDLADVRIDDKSVIDVVATVALAISRELNEEICFRHGSPAKHFYFDEVREDFKARGEVVLTPKFCGVINDLSDAVGRVHFGCVFVIDVPRGYEPVCRESELETVGFVSLDDAKARDLENWSRLLIDDPAFFDGMAGASERVLKNKENE